MTTWTFIWLMFLLKIPIVALFLIVRWAIRQTPETAGNGDGGTGPRARPRQRHHPRAPLPRLPRRGPHGGASRAAPTAPSRVRSHAVSARSARG